MLPSEAAPPGGPCAHSHFMNSHFINYLASPGLPPFSIGAPVAPDGLTRSQVSPILLIPILLIIVLPEAASPGGPCAHSHFINPHFINYFASPGLPPFSVGA